MELNPGQAIKEYLAQAELASGLLFRPLYNSRSEKLAGRRMSSRAMYRLLMNYLEGLPEAMREEEMPDGTLRKVCIYSPHSMRATTATRLLDLGVDIRKVQELPDHRHVMTTQIYDKRRRTTAESAPHDLHF